MIGVTLIAPSGQPTTGVYEDADGVPVFETDDPYLLADGTSLVSPMPVVLVPTRRYTDGNGNPQTALAVSGLAQ